jgi:hypothetical protein
MTVNKILPDDEGELTIAVYIKDQNIVIHFGKSVKWVGLDVPATINLIQTLSEKLAALTANEGQGNATD